MSLEPEETAASAGEAAPRRNARSVISIEKWEPSFGPLA